MLIDLAPKIIGAVSWGAQHEPQIGYSQPFRAQWLSFPKWHLPMKADCSSFVTWGHWVVGAPNPGFHDYSVIEDTEGLAVNGTEISLSQLQPVNLCILGLDGPHENQHVVMVIDVTNQMNPLVVSHGSEAGPVVRRLNDDQRSKRFFRYNTTITVPDPPPEEIEMEFIAQGPTSTASFLYDTQTMTRRGLSKTDTVAGLEKVGIKNYDANLSKTFRDLFVAKPNID